MILIREIKTLI